MSFYVVITRIADFLYYQLLTPTSFTRQILNQYPAISFFFILFLMNSLIYGISLHQFRKIFRKSSKSNIEGSTLVTHITVNNYNIFQNVVAENYPMLYHTCANVNIELPNTQLALEDRPSSEMQFRISQRLETIISHFGPIVSLLPAVYEFPVFNYADLSSFVPNVLAQVYGREFNYSELYRAIIKAHPENPNHPLLQVLTRENAKIPLTRTSFTQVFLRHVLPFNRKKLISHSDSLIAQEYVSPIRTLEEFKTRMPQLLSTLYPCAIDDSPTQRMFSTRIGFFRYFKKKMYLEYLSSQSIDFYHFIFLVSQVPHPEFFFHKGFESLPPPDENDSDSDDDDTPKDDSTDLNPPRDGPKPPSSKKRRNHYHRKFSKSKNPAPPPSSKPTPSTDSASSPDTTVLGVSEDISITTLSPVTPPVENFKLPHSTAAELIPTPGEASLISIHCDPSSPSIQPVIASVSDTYLTNTADQKPLNQYYTVFFCADNDNIPYLAKADSCSSHSFISLDLLDDLGETSIIDLHHPKITVGNAFTPSNAEFPYQGITLSFYIEKIQYTEVFVVVRQRLGYVILGDGFNLFHPSTLPPSQPRDPLLINLYVQNAFRSYHPGPTWLPPLPDSG